jgi:uncharacterized protein YdaU (DUF1376 family)
MSAQPWMPLYVADYLGDTQHLTTEEHGAYMLILMAMWRHGSSLRNDPKLLARISGVSVRRWLKMAPNIVPMLKDDGEYLSSPRLAKEYQKARDFRQKQSANAQAGVVAKALKNNNTPPANGSAKTEFGTTLPQSQRKNNSTQSVPYAFVGNVIRLNQSDFDKWQEAFKNVDLLAHLTARDAYLAELPADDRRRINWFASTSADLRNKNQAAKPRGTKSTEGLAAEWGGAVKRQFEEREWKKPSAEQVAANLQKLQKARPMP